jgi:hypothetical protein
VEYGAGEAGQIAVLPVSTSITKQEFVVKRELKCCGR